LEGGNNLLEVVETEWAISGMTWEIVEIRWAMSGDSWEIVEI
jgi:hypothetical protein